MSRRTATASWVASCCRAIREGQLWRKRAAMSISVRGQGLPRAPDLLGIKEGIQPTVERRGSARDQCGFKDFKQFLSGGAEAYGPLHMGHQTLPVRTPKRQEGDGYEF